MKRLPRILLNVVTMLSLVLCVATVVLWVRSYWVAEHWTRGRFDHDERFVRRDSLNVWFVGGALRVDTHHRHSSTEVARRTNSEFEDTYRPATYYSRRSSRNFGNAGWEYPTVSGEPDSPADGPIDGGRLRWFKFLGFKWAWWESDGRKAEVPNQSGYATGTERSIPLLFVVLLAAALPTARLTAILKRRRLHRARAEGSCPSCGYDIRATPDRCPECGRVAAPSEEGDEDHRQ